MLRSSRTGTSAFIIFLLATIVVAPPAASAEGIHSPRARSNTMPPTVSIDTPAPGATVSGTITVAGTASDDLGIVKVKYRVDTKGNYQLAAGTTDWSGSIDTMIYSDGAHVLSVRAVDNSGNGTTATASFVIANGTVPPGPGPSPSPSPIPSSTPTPGLPGPEPVGPGGGVFSADCAFDHQSNDDPIVFYGQTGAAHLHDFFGAVGVDAFSTPDGMRGTGTTCTNKGDTGAYWAPALIGPDGRAFQPSNVLAYYRAPVGTPVRAFPHGLKVVAGVGATQGYDSARFGYSCSSSGPFAAVPIDCSSGYLKLHIEFPDCWDGVNLDSADHRSHMSYTCDAAHPIQLPKLSIHVQYRGLRNGSQYHLAPSMDGSIPGPHADYVSAWQAGSLEEVVASCLNTGADCKKQV